MLEWESSERILWSYGKVDIVDEIIQYTRIRIIGMLQRLLLHII
jgi:hypothetical protein